MFSPAGITSRGARNPSPRAWHLLVPPPHALRSMPLASGFPFPGRGLLPAAWKSLKRIWTVGGAGESLTNGSYRTRTNPAVTIIMGSISDRKVGERAVKIFEELAIPYQWRVASAHRTPELVEEIMRTSGSSVFIGIAGMAAHLPGVMASHTIRPVIAVPVSASLNGLDALLAAVQMPPGIPVATVTLDRGDNAALLAAEILAVADPALSERLRAHRMSMKETVRAGDGELAG